MAQKRKYDDLVDVDIFSYITDNLYSPRIVSNKDDIMKMSIFTNAQLNEMPYSCKDYDAEFFSAIMPQLSFPQQKDVLKLCDEGIIYGFAGEVSIAKVRGETFDTFCRTLCALSQSWNGPLLNIIKIPQEIDIKLNMEKNDLKMSIQWKSSGKKGDFEFSYNNLRNIFETRSDLLNLKTFNADKTMIKILSLLNEISFINKSNIPYIQKAINCIGLIANAKPVLDIGALYAILEPTFNYNQKCGFSNEEVNNRIETLNRTTFLLDNNNINYENIHNFIETNYNKINELPKNAILETADGAAATIAGNYFTILSDVSKEISRPTPFMNVDRLFKIIMKMIIDNNFKEDIIKNDIKNSNDVIIKKITILQILYQKTTFNNKENCFIIDLFYSIIDSIKNNITLYNKLIQRSTTQGPVYFPIKKTFFDLFSVAKFIYTSRFGLLNMKEILMSCNFDSQCHDNGNCQYYRLICIYFFILYCKDYKSAWINLIGNNIYWNAPWSSVTDKDGKTTIDGNERLNNKKNSVVNFYKEFENFEFYLEKLLQNFNDEQKMLFYELALKDYKSIETLLNQKMLQTCDIVLGVKNSNDIYVISPIRFNTESTQLVYETIKTLPELPQSQIAGDIMPFFSNISIDLGIHWTVSALKNVKESSLNTSQLIFTPISYIDAASNRMYSTAEYIDTPIKMPLNLYDNEPERNSGYTFIRSIDKKTNILNPSENTINKITDNDYLNKIIYTLKQIKFINETEISNKVKLFETIYFRFKPVIISETGIRKFEYNLDDIQKLPGYSSFDENQKNETVELFNSINRLMNIKKSQISNTDYTLDKFRLIFNNFYKKCGEFRMDRESAKKTKKTIKSFNFLETIDNLIVDLSFFFRKDDSAINPIPIETLYLTLYSRYLKFLIDAILGIENTLSFFIYNIVEYEQSIKRRKIGGNIKNNELLTPIKILPIDINLKSLFESQELDKPFITEDIITKYNINRKSETIIQNNNKITLSDFVGLYGSHLSINDDGTFSIKSINSIGEHKQLKELFLKLYNISPGGKTEEWWKQFGNKIRDNQYFKNLPQEEKDKKYTEIITSIFNKIKTEKDENKIIQEAMQEAKIYPQLSFSKTKELSPPIPPKSLSFMPPMPPAIKVAGSKYVTKKRKYKIKNKTKKYNK